MSIAAAPKIKGKNFSSYSIRLTDCSFANKLIEVDAALSAFRDVSRLSEDPSF